jgi:predicted dehydrogenase
MGVVGLHFGRWIIREIVPKFGQGLVEVTKVCDLLPERLAEFSDFPGTSRVEDLLEDPEIDVIGLFVGPVGRAKFLDRCLDAGKDVMTTKPFELDAEEASRILYRAREMGRVVHMNSPNPKPASDLQMLLDLVKDGTLGNPTMALSTVWVYYGETEPDGTWYDDQKLCPAAPIFRLGIYPLNSLSQIFGPAATVQVQSTRVETHRPTADNAAMTIVYQSGAIATLAASFVVGGKDFYRNSITLCGTKGVAYLDTGPRPREDNPPPLVTVSTEDRLETHTLTTKSGDYDWEFFYQRVTGQVKEDITTPEQVAESIRIVDAMRRSEVTGCAEQV